MKKLLLAAAAILALTVPATAGPIYSFDCITGNNLVNCAAGESQLGVEVIDGGGLVSFLFKNAVGAAMSITDIYFDDSSLLDPDEFTWVQSPGVAFFWRASPPNLPAGSSISPAFVAVHSLDSNPPVAPNGINSASEWLEVQFGLLDRQTYEDVLSDLASGDLRIGLHIQAFEGGGSESFINNGPNNPPPPPIPEPGTMFLLGSGIAALVARRRLS